LLGGANVREIIANASVVIALLKELGSAARPPMTSLRNSILSSVCVAGRANWEIRAKVPGHHRNQVVFWRT
jgi:hypothetical protein